MNPKSMLFRALAVTAGLALAATQTASACTGILLRNADGTIVHGRTVEFGIR
jgi:choloylglycine hydrolase